MNESERIAKLTEQVQIMAAALKYYADSPKPNEFLIVTAKDRAFISDFADWGLKAREALDKAGC